MSVCKGCGAELAPNRAPGRKREWCSERCRKAQYGVDPCVDCGAPTSSGPRNGYAPEPRCVGCEHALEVAIVEARLVDVVALRAEGYLNYEIAEMVGTTPAAVASLVYRARRAGIEVSSTPYRPTAVRRAA